MRPRLFAALVCISVLIWQSPAWAAQATDQREVFSGHAIAMHGEPKYGPDFKHFDYVNPYAPKGGSLRVGTRGTFDNFHGYIPKGNSASTGSVETLLTSSDDEPFTMYGLIAQSVTWPRDRSWVEFELRPQARWHDGTSISVDDVIWSFETLTTKGSPQYRFMFGGVESVEKVGERRVRFQFRDATNRELPLIVGQMPILPKHYWATRDFEKTTLEPPLGSGPYRVKRFEAGRYVELERVEDYWGKRLPVNVGRDNLDLIRTEYFRDDTAIRIAVKSGDLDYRQENQAKAWALDYDVPAVRKGWLTKQAVPHQQPTGMQAFVYNNRRALFNDPKVREALAYAFDFEWTNRNLFFSQYTRTRSYFSNSELASSGLPEGRELEILDQYRGQLPERVFTTEYEPPSTDGSGWPRANLREAFKLLDEAGWVVRDNRLVRNDTGAPFEFEILLVSPDFERVVLPFIRNLKRLGIVARPRLVDSSQYINRLRAFDFDMFVFVWGQAESPGNEQRIFWSSAAADQADSRNFAGIRNQVVDDLIEGLIAAESREELVAYTRALDRVLLWGFHVIPNWHLRAARVLYWDKYARPQVPIKSGVSTDRWWYDPEKARALEQAMASDTSLSEQAPREQPGWLATAATVVALLLAFYWLIARVMRRKEG